jgi:pSer/pThr/pTyr-binding forkhead associated (FHA) protein
LVRLEADSVSVGKAPANGVVIDDPAVSRLHAVLERLPAGWTLRDLGSRNGTYLNGERMRGSVVLRPGDQIRLGSADMIFRGTDAGGGEETSPLAAPPLLTRRERDVVVALCRPLGEGDIFCEPASLADMATELTVTQDAVKKHLARLYGKFGIYEGPGSRRVRLANAVIATGAISVAELRS